MANLWNVDIFVVEHVVFAVKVDFISGVLVNVKDLLFVNINAKIVVHFVLLVSVNAKIDVSTVTVGRLVGNYVFHAQNLANGDAGIINARKYAANHVIDHAVMNPVE